MPLALTVKTWAMKYITVLYDSCVCDFTKHAKSRKTLKITNYSNYV